MLYGALVVVTVVMGALTVLQALSASHEDLKDRPGLALARVVLACVYQGIALVLAYALGAWR